MEPSLWEELGGLLLHIRPLQSVAVLLVEGDDHHGDDDGEDSEAGEDSH